MNYFISVWKSDYEYQMMDYNINKFLSCDNNNNYYFDDIRILFVFIVILAMNFFLEDEHMIENNKQSFIHVNAISESDTNDDIISVEWSNLINTQCTKLLLILILLGEDVVDIVVVDTYN